MLWKVLRYGFGYCLEDCKIDGIVGVVMVWENIILVL